MVYANVVAEQVHRRRSLSWHLSSDSVNIDRCERTGPPRITFSNVSGEGARAGRLSQGSR
jgi:hypothetical protein